MNVSSSSEQWERNKKIKTQTQICFEFFKCTTTKRFCCHFLFSHMHDAHVTNDEPNSIDF